MSRLIMPSILNSGSSGGDVFLAAINSGLLYKYDLNEWVNVSPAGAQSWRYGSVSNDGKKWIFPAYAGRIWHWNGSSYNEQRPKGNVNGNWFVAAISGDGSKMLAGEFDGRLYYYDGSFWAEIQPAGNVNYKWDTATMNYDGTKFLVSGQNARLFYFNGSSFSEERPNGLNANGNWKALSIDKTGDKLVAGSSRIYEKEGAGAWTEVQPAGNVNRVWSSASFSPKGFKHYVSGWFASTGYSYFFDGSNWVNEGIFNNASLNVWGSMANNGRRILAGQNNRLYINLNDGNGFIEHQPAGNSNQAWISIATNKGF